MAYALCFLAVVVFSSFVVFHILDQKVAQLRNDVDELMDPGRRDRPAQSQERQHQQQEQQQQQQQNQDLVRKVEGIREKLELEAERFGRVEGSVVRLHARLDAVEARMEAFGERSHASMGDATASTAPKATTTTTERAVTAPASDCCSNAAKVESDLRSYKMAVDGALEDLRLLTRSMGGEIIGVREDIGEIRISVVNITESLVQLEESAVDRVNGTLQESM